MYGMGSREPGGLKAKAGKQGICFHQAFERVVWLLSIKCFDCGHTIRQQRLVAKLSKGESTSRRGSSAHVLDTAVDAHLGLKPCRQGVAHSGDERTNWAFRDDCCVHQNKVRIATVDAVLFHRPCFRVDHRKGTARSIAGSNGWAVDNRKREIRGDGAGGVQCLPASSCNHNMGLRGSCRLASTTDFRSRAFAGEREDHMAHPYLGKGLHPSLREEANGAASGNNNGWSIKPEVADFGAELPCGVRALSVAGGSAKYLK